MDIPLPKDDSQGNSFNLNQNNNKGNQPPISSFFQPPAGNGPANSSMGMPSFEGRPPQHSSFETPALSAPPFPPRFPHPINPQNNFFKPPPTSSFHVQGSQDSFQAHPGPGPPVDYQNYPGQQPPPNFMNYQNPGGFQNYPRLYQGFPTSDCQNFPGNFNPAPTGFEMLPGNSNNTPNLTVYQPSNPAPLTSGVKLPQPPFPPFLAPPPVKLEEPSFTTGHSSNTDVQSSTFKATFKTSSLPLPPLPPVAPILSSTVKEVSDSLSSSSTSHLELPPLPPTPLEEKTATPLQVLPENEEVMEVDKELVEETVEEKKEVIDENKEVVDVEKEVLEKETDSPKEKMEEMEEKLPPLSLENEQESTPEPTKEIKTSEIPATEVEYLNLDSSTGEEEKESESSMDALALAINKQHIEIVTSVELEETNTKKDTTVDKAPITKKLNLPCLSKEAAKKRLKAFSSSQALIRDKPKLPITIPFEDNEEKCKTILKDFSKDDDKKEVIKKKKKKEEKVSVIEQIRDEETRIKEVLNLTTSGYSPYGIGLGLSELNNLLDNPEALKKFEERGKDFKEKLERGELSTSSPVRKSSRSSRDRDIKSSRSSIRNEYSSKERSRESSNKSSRDAEKKEQKSYGSKYSESRSMKTKIKEAPKSWKEFRSLKMTFEEIRKCLKSQHSQRRSPSLSPIRSRRDAAYSSRSPNTDRHRGNKNYPFPKFPKVFQPLIANKALSYGTKEYKGSMVFYTSSRPSLSFSIDSEKYKDYYWNRRELAMKNKTQPEILDILDDFWECEIVWPKEKVQLKRRFYLSIEDWLSGCKVEEEKKMVSPLEYESSNYKSINSSQFIKEECNSKSSDEEEDEDISESIDNSSQLDDKSPSLSDVSFQPIDEPCPSDFIASPSDYKASPSDFKASPSDCKASPFDYKASPFDYKASPSGYKASPSDYKASPSDYKARPSDYKARPSEYIASPSEYIASPSEYIASPSEYIASPSEHIASPSEHIASPSEHIASPSEHIASPSEYIASPSEYIASPSEYIASPSEYIASPSEYIASPSEYIASPSECIASPSKYIASPSKYIASPSKYITSPSEHKASPSDIKATPSDIKATPSDIKATHSDIKASPSDIKASPSDIKASPSDIKASPSDIKASPSDYQDSPSDYQDSPSDSKDDISDQKESPLSNTQSPIESKAESTEQIAASTNKLSTEELNEEYEAFINTLEYKPDETSSLSEEFEFNSSVLSFEEAVDDKDKKQNKYKEMKEEELFQLQPKTRKEIKQLLTMSGLTKNQRKELKKLKKKLKKEKRERKKMKKEVKKKQKIGKKMKKMEKENEDWSRPSSSEEVSLYDDLEEPYEDACPPKSEEATFEAYQDPDWVDYNEKCEALSSEPDKEFDSLDSSQLPTYASATHNRVGNLKIIQTGSSHFYGSDKISQSHSESDSIPFISQPETVTSFSHFEDVKENEMHDRYSPSNMSVCSMESSSDGKMTPPYSPPSPEHCKLTRDTKSDILLSPYSPSSPQSSNSDSGEQDGVIPSVDAIPMPPSALSSFIQVSLSEESTKKSTDKEPNLTLPETIIKPLSEVTTNLVSSVKEEITPDKNEQKLQVFEPFKKMQPVAFRLGSSKQSVGLKLLQKTTLPGFSEAEDEERRSPLVDLSDGLAFGKPDRKKLKELLKDDIRPSIKDQPTVGLTTEISKVEEKPIIISQDDSLNQLSDSPDKTPKLSSVSKSYDGSEDKKWSSSSSRVSEKTGEKKHWESDGKREKSHRSQSDKQSTSKSEGKSTERYSDRRDTYSPKRKRDTSPDYRRKRRSRSPPNSRSSQWSYESEGRSYSSRSRSPLRRENSRSPPYRRRLSTSPERFPSKGQPSHWDSKSQSPGPKWKRVQSPKRYRDDSPEWGSGQEDKRRLSYSAKEGDHLRSPYSPRSNRGKSHSIRDKSPQPSKGDQTPPYKVSQTSTGKSSPQEEFVVRPIDSISSVYRPPGTQEDWDWSGTVNPDAAFYSRTDDMTESLASPIAEDGKSSPKRLSLNERLKQEHGLEVKDDAPNTRGYYWELTPPPMQMVAPCPGAKSGSPPHKGKGQVIRVGNVLQILPEESSPEKPPQDPLQESSYEAETTPPIIVQTGNVIEVLPSGNFQAPSLVKTEASKSPSDRTIDKADADQFVNPLTESPQQITPLPPPTPLSSITPSNPLAFISSLLASSMSQPLPSISDTPVATTPSETVPHDSPTMEQTHVTVPMRPHTEPETRPIESPMTTLDSQQQAILSAAVAAAASGVPASNSSIAHLISVLHQQSLLTQPAPVAAVVPEQVAPITPIETPSVEAQPQEQPQLDLEAFRKMRRQRKERKKKEREARQKLRREKALRRKAEAEQRKAEREKEAAEDKEDSPDEDDAVFKEAITEVPELGSPVPDYEIYNDDDDMDDDDEAEEKKPAPVPLPDPPEKGILIGFSYRFCRNIQRKSVSFADGVAPGDGTSPSGGEEIHSPPPPEAKTEKKEKKKLRKKKKVKVKIIKQYTPGNTRMDSPPPPPETLATSETLKLYPGCTYYTCTSPGTFVIYTQQPMKTNGANVDLGIGNSVTIPPGMLIHSSALSTGMVPGGAIVDRRSSIPPSLPHTFPRYPFFTFPDGSANESGAPVAPLLQSPLA